MHPQIRSDRLEVFETVVREGGFSKAARVLGTTQSSVSQSIAALEADIGEPVFVRAGRRFWLSDAGQTLHAHAVAVLGSLETTRAALEQHRDEVGGRLALGASDTLSTWVLPEVFAKFRRAYPAVELRLDNRPSPAVAEAVAARQLDVGVVTLPLPPWVSAPVRALKQLPLREQKDVVAVPRGHPLARRASVRPEELAKHPLLLLDRSTASRAWLDAHFASAGVQPRVVMEMSSVEVLKRLAALGFGAAVLPQVALADTATLRRVQIHGVHQRRMLGLLTGQNPTRAAAAFIDIARELLRRPS